MHSYRRYAVYYAPEAGEFADRASAWLGWDPAAARPVAQPDLGITLAELTGEPMRYGFHATLKPPFRLAEGRSVQGLDAAMTTLAGRLAPAAAAALEPEVLGGFLALVPKDDSGSIQSLAAAVLRGLDQFRAPLSAEDLAKRPPGTLTPRQAALQILYGYPYVLEEFRFHLTLSGKLAKPQVQPVRAAAMAYLGPVLPRPFRIRDICLFGEQDDGRFRLLRRYPLGGAPDLSKPRRAS